MKKVILVIILALISSFAFSVTEADIQEVKELFNTIGKAIIGKDIEATISVFGPDSTLILCTGAEGIRANRIGEIRTAFASMFNDSQYLSFSEEDFDYLYKELSDNLIYKIWETNYKEFASEEVVCEGKCMGSVIYGKRDEKWYIVHLHFTLSPESY